VSTGFIDGTTGVDIAVPLVDKSYLIDRYPELAETFRFAGLWTWGNDLAGSLGNNATAHRSSPVQTIAGGYNWKMIAGGGNNTITAIKTDGTLWGWGDNQSGALGDNTIANKSSPVQTVAGGTTWKQNTIGSTHVAAIKTDGTLWLWGYNSTGTLGDNTVVAKSSPIQTVAGGTNWKLVSGGSAHTAAIKTDGTLWIWGNSALGQLGDGTIVAKSSPVQTIAGGTNWRQVSAGIYHTAAIKTDGTLWLWGHNNYGTLGDNTITHRSSPVQTISGGNNWRLVSAGHNMNAAIKTDGTLWTWGRNGSGSLGDNTTVWRSSPVQTVAGGTNWRLVSAGNYWIEAIKADGTLWTWGDNLYGQLGDNTTVSKSSPIQTVAGGNNWKLVAAGRECAAAIRDNSSDVFGNPL
jgi:alpha-tubulin suppressor-like RCC1 family protein